MSCIIVMLSILQPTPIYVMDEIDAALDHNNVAVVANYIKQCTTDAQFIVISLRNHMYEIADRLVGIYKTHDVTKSVAIDPRVYERPPLEVVEASKRAAAEAAESVQAKE